MVSNYIKSRATAERGGGDRNRGLVLTSFRWSARICETKSAQISG